MSNASSKAHKHSSGQKFATTHWSLILAAGHRSSLDSDDALESLCRTYWYPLYVYAQRRVSDVQQAQDLTQAFFARVLEKNFFETADPQRGRFRAFLLTAFKRFLVNEWEKDRAAKRGGGKKILSFNFDSGESQYTLEPADHLTPERRYEQQWALTMLEHVVAKLRDEFVATGKEAQFNHLKVFITGPSQTDSYAAAAMTLGISEGAAKVAAHRMRQRYRELLRAEIAQTVTELSEVDDEIRNLFDVLGS